MWGESLVTVLGKISRQDVYVCRLKQDDDEGAEQTEEVSTAKGRISLD